jgi:hypothetical protein
MFRVGFFVTLSKFSQNTASVEKLTGRPAWIEEKFITAVNFLVLTLFT